MTKQVINHEPICDIIIPIFNGLSHLTPLIESLTQGTELSTTRIILIDDASDERTAQFLVQAAKHIHNALLLVNPINLGFVQSCIRGYQTSAAPFLVLLNSDVVVTPGWLDRLLTCARSDERIAAVNPLTNQAAHLHAALPPGANFLGMDALLRRRRPTYPDVVTMEGFCLLLRRRALQKVGFFDPIFGRGYCEESDLGMRLITHGYRTVVADDVYVYHHGSGTFGQERGPRYLANRKIFDERWGKEYRRRFSAFRRADPLRPVRTIVPLAHRWDPKPSLWCSGRALRQALAARTPWPAARALVKGLLDLPRALTPRAQREQAAAVTLPGRLRVTYLIDRLLVSGGVLSVIQLVNQLILLGVEARIATLFEDTMVYDWMPLYTRPLVYRNSAELIAQSPPTDIVVATLWSTAPWAKALVDGGQARHGVYLIQDYEPWFFPANATRQRAAIQSSYGLLPHRIVMSEWLREKLAALGYGADKIPLGMNLDCFYPREVSAHPPTLTAMARPGTPYRGYDTLLAAFRLVKASRPEVRIRLFGDANLKRRRILFAFKDEGIITHQERLAQLYSATDVFLDASDFQGFGRCGLEAMACGTACVLTQVGGVNEYARDGYNALLFPPGQPEPLAQAMLYLLDNPGRRAALGAAGQATAQGFCHRQEARTTLSYLHHLLAGTAPMSEDGPG